MFHRIQDSKDGFNDIMRKRHILKSLAHQNFKDTQLQAKYAVHRYANAHELHSIEFDLISTNFNFRLQAYFNDIRGNPLIAKCLLKANLKNMCD